jgi:tRNA/tmRNA/rRNA uracil-C5-methylase (TrmA/RlmC/RlmD family)
MPPERPAVADVVELQVGPVAHGGHCVARAGGLVVFVRHALPGELVRARITEVRSRLARADAIEVLRPHADRVIPACPQARPGGCGGCDWQHARPAAQRALKAAVVVEALTRLGRLTPEHPIGPGVALGDLTVVAADVGSSRGGRGWGWRTRVQFAVVDGRAGLRRHRSHEVVAIEGCPIAHPGIADLDVPGRRWPGACRVEAVVSSTGERLLVVTGSGGGEVSLPPLPPDVSVIVNGVLRRGRVRVREQAPGGTAVVSGAGFWQVHPAAPALLVEAVLAALPAQPRRLADLYAGVGLFSMSLAPLVGPHGSVLHVEADPVAVRDARRTLHRWPQVRIVAGRVDAVLADPARHQVSQDELRSLDAVVLDPPRTGAGRDVVESLARLRGPRWHGTRRCWPAWATGWRG